MADDPSWNEEWDEALSEILDQLINKVITTKTYFAMAEKAGIDHEYAETYLDQSEEDGECFEE